MPDDKEQIQTSINSAINLNCNLIITTGGTGFSQRDVTRSAVDSMFSKKCEALTAMMQVEACKMSKWAVMSNPCLGIIGNALVVVLPGSPKAVGEFLGIVLPFFDHIIQVLSGSKKHPTQKGIEEDLSVQKGIEEDLSTQDGEDLSILSSSSSQHSIKSELEDYYSVEVQISNATKSNHLSRSCCTLHGAIPFEDAQMILNSITIPLEFEITDFPLGRISACDVECIQDKPPFNVSLFDGFAVQKESNDTEFVLRKIQDRVGICDTRNLVIESGKCIRVNTGSKLPLNTDYVVKIEDTKECQSTCKFSGNQISDGILFKVPAVNGVREKGSDLKKGDLLIRKDSVIDAVDLCLLGSVKQQVRVKKKLGIGFMTTGTEIEMIGDSIRPGIHAIFDSNKHLSLTDYGNVEDNKILIKQRLESITEPIIVITGGMSRGDCDYVRPILYEMADEILFERLLIKPGLPTMAIRSKDKVIFGLAGNPVSALVMFHTLVLPFTSSVCGIASHEKLELTLSHDIQLDVRPQWHRVKVRDNVATSTGNQNSSCVASLKCDAFLFLPASSELEIASAGSAFPAIKSI